MRLLLALAALLVAAAFVTVGLTMVITGRDVSPAAATDPTRRVADEDARAVGATAIGMGLVPAFVALALLRARARDRREHVLAVEAAARLGLPVPRRASGSGGAWKPVAALGAGLAVLAARFGDDFARHADDLGAVRGLDELAFGAPAPGARALSEEDFFEGALEAVQTALDLSDVRELYDLIRAESGADVVVDSRLAFSDTTEEYVRRADGAYELRSQRQVVHRALARDGVVVDQESRVDTEPLDTARGERCVLRITQRPPDATGRELADVVVECLVAFDDGALESVTFVHEAELTGTTLDPNTGEATVHLRSTEAGSRAVADAWAALVERVMGRKPWAETLGVARVEVGVRVPAVAELELALTGDRLSLAAPGATTILVAVLGRR